jgi:hypothetical protein
MSHSHDAAERRQLGEDRGGLFLMQIERAGFDNGGLRNLNLRRSEFGQRGACL